MLGISRFVIGLSCKIHPCRNVGLEQWNYRVGDIKGACLDARESVNLGFQNEEYNCWINKIANCLSKI